ncbi:hypothetical protein [Micromonospora sp. ATA51]|uniref:hypothetical protein n=1 Tax=Micromonospora sp. ATA51 TaxID=2806098 RepID=UPI001A4B36A3|nr:hypothetical protein [Micromonospora sp. ATA51]MBM0228267.1 hypothetical protein [Micromonospora sp. ATA51]
MALPMVQVSRPQDPLRIADDLLRGQWGCAALDSGADPAVVSRWIADVLAEQVTADAKLRRLNGRQTMSPDEIRHIVETLGNITAVLRDANPADRALIYRELGLNLTYRPTARTVSAQANPSGSCTKLCPRGDLNPAAPDL